MQETMRRLIRRAVGILVDRDRSFRFIVTHYVLRYLIKSDQYLKVKLKKNDRSIGKGMVLMKKSNAGRPRKVIES